MELQKVVEWLMTEGFVIMHKGKPKFTSLFQKAYNGVERGLTQQGTVLEPGLPTVPDNTVTRLEATPAKLSTYSYKDWVDLYMQFIKDAEVPRTLSIRYGDVYYANKFSEDGLKAFQKALKSGADYKVLVGTVRLYYKSGVNAKKAIGNYMSQGDWRTDYQEVLQKAEAGKLKEHIKKETKSHEHNAFRLG